MFQSRFANGIAVALLTYAPPAFAQQTFNGAINANANPGFFRPGVYGNVYQGNQIDFRSGNFSGPGALNFGFGYFGGYQQNSVPIAIQADPQQYQRRVAEIAAQRTATQVIWSEPPNPTPARPPDAGSPPPTGVTIPSPPASATARITVRVPADAELWFENVKTQKTGTERVFTTPAVQSGRHYGYLVKARWTVDGRSVTHERMVRFQAGREVEVRFDQPDEVATPNAPVPASPNQPSLGSPSR